VDTRTSLIEWAERLFAERGINGVSLREIGAAAGQRNTGAARYHFGSKEGLLDAVFRYRMEPINERRMTLLDGLDGEGRGHELRGLAEAILYPLSEVLGDIGRPSWYLRFCVHAAFVEGTAPSNLGRQPWTHGVFVVHQRFDQVLAELGFPTAVRADRWALFGGHMAHALADREHVIQYGPWRGLTDRALFLSGVVDTAVAVAGAPLSSETLNLLDQRRPA